MIVGGGFGGLSAAEALRGASDIAVPIRWILRHDRNVNVRLGNVVAIDPVRREVRLDDADTPVCYDHLILATSVPCASPGW